eukprot:8223344-Pyramimonas_sp.AAC.1
MRSVSYYVLVSANLANCGRLYARKWLISDDSARAVARRVNGWRTSTRAWGCGTAACAVVQCPSVAARGSSVDARGGKGAPAAVLQC